MHAAAGCLSFPWVCFCFLSSAFAVKGEKLAHRILLFAESVFR